MCFHSLYFAANHKKQTNAVLQKKTSFILFSCKQICIFLESFCIKLPSFFLRNIQKQNLQVKVETFLNSFWMNLIRSWVDGHSISRGGTFNNLFHWELLTVEFRYQIKMKLIKKTIFKNFSLVLCMFTQEWN